MTMNEPTRGPYRREVEALAEQTPAPPKRGEPGWVVDTRGAVRELRWWDGRTWSSKIWRNPAKRADGGNDTIRGPLRREVADLEEPNPIGARRGSTGWFVDPRNVSQLRWWAGGGWTSKVWVAPATENAEERSTEPGRRIGEILAKCPTCQTRNVEAAAELRTIRGYILYCTMGTTWAVGCRDCVAVETRRVAGRNMLTGWWSFPWGLTTPFIVIGNLLRGLMPQKGALRKFSKESGVDLGRYTVGEDYLTTEERQMITALLLAAGRIGEVSGRPAIPMAAVLFVEEYILENEVPRRYFTKLGAANSAVIEGIEKDLLLLFLRLIAKSIQETGGIEDSIRAEYASIVSGFGINIRIEELLGGTGNQDRRREETGPGGTGDGPYRVLGLQSTASLNEVKKRHRELILRHHPDRAQAEGRDVGEATRRTQAINEAYREILQTFGT